MDAHKNFAYGTVATAPSPALSGTSLVLQTGQGALMPTPPFNAIVWPVGVQPVASNAEIVRVTAVVSNTCTITRTQEGTAARAITVGDQFAAGITAKLLTDIEAALQQSVAIPITGIAVNNYTIVASAAVGTPDDYLKSYFRFDATNYSQISVQAQIRTGGTVYPATAVLRPQYSTNSGTNWNYPEASGICSVQVDTITPDGSVAPTSGWLNLATAAKADVDWRLVLYCTTPSVSTPQGTLFNVIVSFR